MRRGDGKLIKNAELRMMNELDHLFEQGVSDVARAPRQMLTDAEIASAAAASKTSAGIWLLSHAKEILVGAISFAMGVGTTLLATHALHGKAPSQLPAEQTALMTADSLSEETLSDDTAVYKAESNEHNVVQPENQTTSTSTSSTTASQKNGSVETTASKAATAPTTAGPVVIKKTVVQRDTMRKQEQIIIRDTVYVIEN